MVLSNILPQKKKKNPVNLYWYFLKQNYKTAKEKIDKNLGNNKQDKHSNPYLNLTHI